MKEIKVSIFEDNKHLRESLKLLLESTPGFVCSGVYPDCNDILFDIRRYTPDVILMDIEMPGLNGIDAMRLVKKEFPDIQVLMQTMFDDDEYLFNAICFGASGYILKSTTPTGYVEAIQDAFNGGSPMTGSIARKVLTLFQKHVSPINRNNYQLTQKEKEILQELVHGKSFKMIADVLGISYETVRTHMKNIYNKLHVNSNTEAVSKAILEKLV